MLSMPPNIEHNSNSAVPQLRQHNARSPDHTAPGSSRNTTHAALITQRPAAPATPVTGRQHPAAVSRSNISLAARV